MQTSELSCVGLSLFALTFTSCSSAPIEEHGLPPALSALAAIPDGDAILSTPPGGSIRIGDELFAIETFDFVLEKGPEGGEQFNLLGIFDQERSTLVLGVEDDEPSDEVLLVHRGEQQPVRDVEFFELDGDDAMGVLGEVDGPDGEPLPLAAVIGFGAGSSTFRLEGDAAFLNGELGSGTYRQVQHLIEHHPEITTIVFEEVPGSMNDEVNVETGRLIRAAGYATVLPEHGMIASGGVVLFCAGKLRVIEGGMVGVHSWGDPGSGVVANDLPRDHEAHRFQVRYFREMLEQGEEFYFYTLAAAPFDDIHWMSPEEIEAWGLESVGQGR